MSPLSNGHGELTLLAYAALAALSRAMRPIPVAYLRKSTANDSTLRMWPRTTPKTGIQMPFTTRWKPPRKPEAVTTLYQSNRPLLVD